MTIKQQDHIRTERGVDIAYRGERVADDIAKAKVPGGYKVVTYTYGTGDDVLLVVHGGPGMASDYVRDTHCVIADRGYQVVCYDQLGSGESDRPDDTSLWTVDRFVDELEAVRTALDLGSVHLLGHSWGTILGQCYCLKYPDGVRTFISVNGIASVPETLKRMPEVLSLETEALQAMAIHEAAGTIDHPDYVSALNIISARHFCRAPQWPACLNRSIERMGIPVYSVMWGNNELSCTGNLKDYDNISELHRIRQRTLLITGRYDKVSPSESATMHREIPNSEMVMFGNSSHTPFIEEPTQYFECLEKFLLG